MTEENTSIPTICLNMIVKNESKIITRLLESVINIIDCYCICDTGSTDNTEEIITSFFKERNIPGKIIHEPFQNFAHNRNVALEGCFGMADYILLMDADMKLRIGIFDKMILMSGDSFLLLQGNDNYYYQNVRIIKNNGLYKYHGVTHEFIACNTQENKKNIEKDILFIEDVGDGGSKTNKFERDIKLLLGGIEKNPEDVRYHFYLANSYFDTGQLEKAIEYYEKRIKLGGWEQEIWQSYYRIGLSYKYMNQMEKAIYYWQEAYQIVPKRLENIYEIINYYRIQGKNHIVKLYYDICNQVLEKEENKKERDHYLFLHNDVYTYKLFYEYSISASYWGVKNMSKEWIEIFNHCNDMNLLNNCLYNMKYYPNVLEKKERIDLSLCFNRPVGKNWVKFYSSSSSILQKKYQNNTADGYVINIRCVNYKINEKGEYIGCEKNVISTYYLMELNKHLQPSNHKDKIFDLVDDGRLYIGVEDVRIFYKDDNSGSIITTGTGYHENKTIGVVVGDFDTTKDVLEFQDIKSFRETSCEKNWVYVNYKGSNHVVYQWYPLQIGKIDREKGQLDLCEMREMPWIFKFARGSSCGFTFKEEIWFLVHLVSYEKPRHYYHMFVVFDADMNLKRYSAPFKFEGECIEYCTGLIVEEERVIVPYSVMDNKTILGVYDKKYIDSKIIFTNS